MNHLLLFVQATRVTTQLYIIIACLFFGSINLLLYCIYTGTIVALIYLLVVLRLKMILVLYIFSYYQAKVPGCFEV
jgi:putative effector of murein hydrolase LrgA (UPF0299 family)